MRDDVDVGAVGKALSAAALTELQMCVVYLRVHHQLGVHATAEALRIAPAEVEKAEAAARGRILAALRKMAR